MNKLIATAEGIASGFFAVPVIVIAAAVAWCVVYYLGVYGSRAWNWVFDRQQDIDVGIGVALFFTLAILGGLIFAKLES